MQITKELSRLQQLALENKLKPEEISGGTITLSNIGAIGGKYGSPLLNLPEVAIIAIGRIQKVPRFADDGGVYPVSVMTVSVSFVFPIKPIEKVKSTYYFHTNYQITACQCPYPYKSPWTCALGLFSRML